MPRRLTLPLARFVAALPVVVRPCAAADLPLLEWHGAFTHHRELIAATFERQRRAECVMMLADVGGFPVGQAWVDLTRKAADGVGVIWAVRVVPALRGAGLGARLLAVCERLLARRGFGEAELGVEAWNGAARRLYERLGYRIAGHARETYAYTPPGGTREEVRIEEVLLRKRIRTAAAARARTVGGIAEVRS